MISDPAIKFMEQTAESVGFGPRPDYPYLGASPLSVADWKGSSIAACVFAYPDHAREYLGKCLRALDALGGGLKGDILTVAPEGSAEMYIAVLTATDLVAKSEISDGKYGPIDTNPYGPEVHPTSEEVLERNSHDPRSATHKQVRALQRLCALKGLTERQLIALGVQEQRLSPRHADNGGTGTLASLTQSEIGGLFAFASWLKPSQPSSASLT